MRCVVGIDLGSTTTKAVLLDPSGEVLGRGITNSRSNYEVACAVAREEAQTDARFNLLRRALAESGASGASGGKASGAVLRPKIGLHLDEDLENAFRLELYVGQLGVLTEEVARVLDAPHNLRHRDTLEPAVAEILNLARAGAPGLFRRGASRKSDFFRDLAAEAFMANAEEIAGARGVSFERLLGLFDRAILDVETRLEPRNFRAVLGRAAERVALSEEGLSASDRARLVELVERVGGEPIEEIEQVGTGYGRQTLPFPKELVRSEILCHGRGAHHMFPGTRTVLDIGGQDTKAIQVDEGGVVTSFQMNDRCAAGCGRYLGYIADELNLGLHELGPLALKARRMVKVNSTCTVFAGAELRERLALGERREDILAGLHRAIMLRAMSLLARSGGIDDEFTFTGGVCKNPMATKILRELVADHYGSEIGINTDPGSIYTGALGAALFALDAARAGARASAGAGAGAPSARAFGD